MKKASLTIETSIVLPLVMLIVVSMISTIIYIHDITAARGRVYSGAIEIIKDRNDNIDRIVNNNLSKTPTYIMSFNAKVNEHIDSYDVILTGKITDKSVFYIVRKYLDYSTTIRIEKTISMELMYGQLTLVDIIKRNNKKDRR